MMKNANDRDSLYLTTRLLRETLESVDLIKSNLTRVGTDVLPESLREAIRSRQVDTSRLNRSAIIAIGMILVEEKLIAAGHPTPKEESDEEQPPGE